MNRIVNIDSHTTYFMKGAWAVVQNCVCISLFPSYLRAELLIERAFQEYRCVEATGMHRAKLFPGVGSERSDRRCQDKVYVAKALNILVERAVRPRPVSL